MKTTPVNGDADADAVRGGGGVWGAGVDGVVVKQWGLFTGSMARTEPSPFVFENANLMP